MIDSALARTAGTTAALRYQTSRTLGAVGLQQPKYLTALQPEKLRRRVGRQPTLIRVPQHLEPRQLAIAHQPNRHP
jgi:hypothetical protein